MQILNNESEIREILSALMVTYTEQKLKQHLPKAFVVDYFGVVLVGLDTDDFVQVKVQLEEQFKGYRHLFLTNNSNKTKIKDEIIWEFMRSGYMRHIRLKYPSQFKTLLLDYNYGRKIIQERLKVWADKPKYKYLIQANEEALDTPISYLLAVEPDFFDYMPEKATY